MKSIEIALLVLIVALVFVGIGVGIYFYAKDHHNEFTPPGGHRQMTLKNTTQLHQTVTLPGNRKVTLQPEQSTHLSLSYDDVLSAKSKNFDGSPNSYTYRLANPKVSSLYITPSGFRSDVTASDNVRLINSAPFSMLFVERSTRGGRRWARVIVPPYSVSEGHFVAKNTIWEVNRVDHEDSPISEVHITGKPSTLLFDGNTLVSF